MSFVTLYHLAEGDGSYLLGTAGAEDLVRVELGRLDFDTVLCLDREERNQDKESTKKADDGADARRIFLARIRQSCRNPHQSINGLPMVPTVPHTRRGGLA
jgi:hypothetical protein